VPFRLAFRMAFSCFLLAVLSFSVGIADPAAPFTPTDAPNMNGAYSISPTPKANPALFPKSYKDYPHGVEYFEVYSQPITTLYSQVPYPPTHTMKLVRLVQRTRKHGHLSRFGGHRWLPPRSPMTSFSVTRGRAWPLWGLRWTKSARPLREMSACRSPVSKRTAEFSILGVRVWISVPGLQHRTTIIM
jgi:hypothetical protein